MATNYETEIYTANTARWLGHAAVPTAINTGAEKKKCKPAHQIICSKKNKKGEKKRKEKR